MHVLMKHAREPEVLERLAAELGLQRGTRALSPGPDEGAMLQRNGQRRHVVLGVAPLARQDAPRAAGLDTGAEARRLIALRRASIAWRGDPARAAGSPSFGGA